MEHVQAVLGVSGLLEQEPVVGYTVDCARPRPYTHLPGPRAGARPCAPPQDTWLAQPCPELCPWDPNCVSTFSSFPLTRPFSRTLHMEFRTCPLPLTPHFFPDPQPPLWSRVPHPTRCPTASLMCAPPSPS